MSEALAGYTYGKADVPPSPVTPSDLSALLASAAFGDDDRAALKLAGEVLADQVQEVLDVWYGFVGSNPHLLAYFSTESGQPIPEYLDRVRGRFGRWIIDTCTRDYDAAWLAYQQEIGRRHTAPGKNTTDGVNSVPHIPLRHVIALIAPITATIRPFLANKGHSAEELERMHTAWTKSVIVQIALWSQPYAGPLW
jgi:hypothetical protein